MFKTGLKPFGEGKFSLVINPKDSGNFDLTYNLGKIPVALFNPYLISYTSFPLDRGTIEFNGVWTVRNGSIKSSNHVVVIDPRVSKRIRNKDTRWMPMPLIMSFIRERGNVIDYKIPITGNLRNPKFHLRDVIFDVVKNIFVKPPTTPYRIEVQNIENEIEKSLTVTWQGRQKDLHSEQERFVRKISSFLYKHPEAQIIVQPFTYESKEKEQILFFETKKKYFMDIHNKNELSRDDSLVVSKMSVKDQSLIDHISKGLSDTVMFALHEKCINFVGNKIISLQYERLKKERENSFLELFIANGTSSQVKIHSDEHSIPYNGFSYFKLSYPGEVPNTLLKAYRKMDDYNQERPRRKYRQQRKKELEAIKKVEN
jgi:hypothetical protein